MKEVYKINTNERKNNEFTELQLAIRSSRLTFRAYFISCLVHYAFIPPTDFGWYIFVPNIFFGTQKAH